MPNRAVACFIGILLAAWRPTAFAQPPEALDPALEFLIGTWEGEATLYAAPGDDRADRVESVAAKCIPILKNAYIQCDTAWRREDGRERTFRLHLNYNQISERHQMLYIYDNWPEHVRYPVDYAPETRSFTGVSAGENADGGAWEERVVWRVSEDGNEIHATEHVRDPGQPDWRLSFEFTWRRASNP